MSPVFSEYISQLPPELTFKYLLRDSHDRRRIVSSSTIRKIVQQYTIPDSLTKRFNALPDSAKTDCALAYLHADKGMPTEPATRFESDKLLCSFLVCAAKDQSGNCFYVGFDEFKDNLSRLLAKVITKRAKASPGRLSSGLLPWYCLNDLMTIAGLAAQGQLKRTKGGTFSKNSSASLDKLLHVSRHQTLMRSGEAATLLLEYALRCGLVVFRDNGYSAGHRSILGWLGQSMRRQHQEFVDFCVAFTGSFRHDILLEALGQKPGEVWLSTAGLRAGDETDIEDIVRMLSYTASVAIDETGGELLFTHSSELSRLDEEHPLGMPAAKVLVMPDFTAILPQEIGPDQLYWFMRLGTLSSLDKVYRGKIDRRILNDSLCQGIDGDELVGCLIDWQAPNNVVETIKEWIREFSRVYLCTETFLVSTDEKVSSQMASYEPLRQLMEPLPLHQVFRVRPGKEREVQDVLFGLGFDPRTPNEIVQEEENGASKDNGTVSRGMVTQFSKVEKEPDAVTLKSGKYSSELKKLDVNEMLHVMDYAILMGCVLRFEYRGSPGQKKGVYTIYPSSVEKGPTPVVMGETAGTQSKRKFLIKEISRLGVEEE